LLGGRVEVASSGARVVDSEGREYLDCGGAGVFLLGHRHPRVVAAVREQLETHPLHTRLLFEPVQALAAERLASVTPEGLDMVQFAVSGADAVELAVKLGRLHGKDKIIAAKGGFHGKTMGALTATGNEGYRAPFHPLLPGAHHVPFGDVRALEAALARHRGDACVFLEPIQSMAGVVVPPAGYLQRAAELCRSHGALFVLDEILTGLGRLGSWWGCEHDGVVPDVLLAGKALTGGVMPVAALAATPDIHSPLGRDPFLHYSTFAGAPIAMAAAEAAVATIEEEGLVERARSLGEEIARGLGGLVATQGIVREVRGRGLLIGVELAAPELAGELITELLGRGVIANPSVLSRPVVTFTPPAVLTDADVAALVQAVHTAVATLAARHPELV